MNLPGLAELLQAFDAAEFRERSPVLCTAHRETWPYAVRDSLALAESAWRRTVGRIEDRAVVTACVESEDAIWCVLRIYFLRVRDDEVSQPVRPPRSPQAEIGAGGELVPSGSAVRVPFSLGMCAAGIGGWGEWR